MMHEFLDSPLRKHVDMFFRFVVLFTGIALLVLALASVLESLEAHAATPALPRVDIRVEKATPRDVEETTRAAIAREYAAAWKTMASALADNTTDGLGASFVGAAHDALAQRVGAQKKAGLSTRIIDHGHTLEAVFYSPEGSAMQLRDTAQLEQQYLDGGSIVHSETITQHYVVLMSVAEDRWKVRMLQEVK
jgi:hypothetical protein